MEQYSRLPPLNALRAFEATAKHLSFTQAAKELSVTLGAVSRQVKTLEESMGITLLERQGRGIKLTRSGQILYDSVSYHFDRLRAVTHRLQYEQTHSFSLAISTAAASFWLMPKLGEFWQQYPDIDVNYCLANTLRGLARHHADLYVRYGNGQWAGHVAAALYTDRLYLVCSPDFYQQYQNQDITALPLLQMADDEADREAWSTWLATANIDKQPQHWQYLSNYTLITAAAEHGQGIAMGWDSLVSGLVAQGKLVKFHPLTIDSPNAIYLTWLADTPLNEDAECFRRWLVDSVNRQSSQPT